MAWGLVLGPLELMGGGVMAAAWASISAPLRAATPNPLRRNTELLDAITDLSNTTSQKAWVAGNKLESLLAKEISEEIEANRKRTDDYVTNDVNQSDVMAKLAPMLRKLGVA